MSGGDHSINEVVAFIRQTDRRGWCFGRWPSDMLEIYLKWHHQNGSLVLVEEDEVLVAVAVGTQMSENDIDKHWVRWNESGDIFYFSDLLAKKKKAVAACFDEFIERIGTDKWRGTKIFALRGGRKRKYEPSYVERWLEAL